jgi:hypothetical protein
MKKYSLLYFLIIFLFAVSCRQDRVNPREAIVNTWVVESVVINGVHDNINNYSDYRFQFRGDNSYTFWQPQENSGTWDISDNGNKLILDEGTTTRQEADIVHIDDNSLSLKFRRPNTHKQNEQEVVFNLVPEN